VTELTSTPSALVEFIGVELSDVTTKLTHCHGAYIRLSWLREVYKSALFTRDKGCTQHELISCTLLGAQHL